MVYSVWNWDSLRYDYYRADGGPLPGQPVLPKKRYKNGDSVRPEDVLPVLPGDALKIGSGDTAQGRVAVRSDEARLGASVPSQGGSILPVVMVAGAGYLLYRMVK